jgi:triphosphoribosyl-dephospho-CoA synthetase
LHQAHSPDFQASAPESSQVFMEAAASTANRQPTLWASLAEAVRGSHQDYTTGSLNRAILLLAVPMVLEMVLDRCSR